MLDYRLFRHQNFLKKVQKKLDFLPKNGKFCVKKSLSPEKFSRFFEEVLMPKKAIIKHSCFSTNPSVSRKNVKKVTKKVLT